jgi:hypothetical protein
LLVGETPKSGATFARAAKQTVEKVSGTFSRSSVGFPTRAVEKVPDTFSASRSGDSGFNAGPMSPLRGFGHSQNASVGWRPRLSAAAAARRNQSSLRGGIRAQGTPFPAAFSPASPTSAN